MPRTDIAGVRSGPPDFELPVIELFPGRFEPGVFASALAVSGGA
jgi:hypothetical protein